MLRLDFKAFFVVKRRGAGVVGILVGLMKLGSVLAEKKADLCH